MNVTVAVLAVALTVNFSQEICPVRPGVQVRPYSRLGAHKRRPAQRFPRAHFVQRTWRGKCAVSH